MVQSVRVYLRFLVFVATTSFIFFAGSSYISAQGQACGVGAKVAFEWSPQTVGTIMEIGTEAPHVGWFGIKFSWSKDIQWAPPKTNGLLVAGTKTPCVGEKTISQQTRPPADSPSSTKTSATHPQIKNPTPPESAGCPFNEPPGKVTRTSAASAALFKRVIYERAAAKINPESITAPKRVGITFSKFEMGAAFKNTWTSPRFGDKRLHTGAPLNATIYPIKTLEVLCELHGENVRRTVTEENRSCFKNKDGDWVCPAGGGGKYIESVLIPVQ